MLKFQHYHIEIHKMKSKNAENIQNPRKAACICCSLSSNPLILFDVIHGCNVCIRVPNSSPKLCKLSGPIPHNWLDKNVCKIWHQQSSLNCGPGSYPILWQIIWLDSVCKALQYGVWHASKLPLEPIAISYESSKNRALQAGNQNPKWNCAPAPPISR